MTSPSAMTKVVTRGRRVGSCTSRTAARAAREAEIEYDEEEAARGGGGGGGGRPGVPAVLHGGVA